jgi:thioredoxin 1
MYFSAPWCGPCKTFKPVLEEVMSGFTDVEFEKIDVDENPELTADHAVRSIPTTVMFANGEEIFRQTGVIGKAWLTNYIETNK